MVCVRYLGQPVGSGLVDYGSAIVHWHDADSLALIRRSLLLDGFVVVRGLTPAGVLAKARREVFGALVSVGELDQATNRSTGYSRRSEVEASPGAFWCDLTYSNPVVELTEHHCFSELASMLLCEPALPDPMIYLRATAGGGGTRIHVDFPRISPGHYCSLTFWLAMVDISPSQGGIFFPQIRDEESNSKQFSAVARDLNKNEWWSASEDRASRTFKLAEMEHTDDVFRFFSALKTMSYYAGDLVVFVSSVLHGTFDHISASSSIRLSVDRRWEPESKPHYVKMQQYQRIPSGYLNFVGSKPLGING